MNTWKFYTPDGVLDWLPEDCESKRRLETGLRQVFSASGYQEIETPGIEFYDAYAAGGGFAPQEGLFKFFDEKGRILCLRYDGTIPAARVAATLLRDVAPPLRLSYIGEMYRYQEHGGGRQREFTQAGVELMGVSGPEADAEVIALAIAGARSCGIENLQVSIGQVAFFKGLLKDYAISAEDALALQRRIDGKEMVALEDLVSQLELPASVRKVLLMMPQLYGTFEVIDQLRSEVVSPLALSALDNLNDILLILQDDALLDYISLDLGMLQSLDYYSGTIFKGFTYGLGFPLFSGGRYDQITEAFGRNLSSTGFSIGLNFVMTALRRQQIRPEPAQPIVMVGYAPKARIAAFDYARLLRATGMRAVMDCQRCNESELIEQASRHGAATIHYVLSDTDVHILQGDIK
jgi:ATP phosphoribosyltransferase regulatory subunit